METNQQWQLLSNARQQGQTYITNQSTINYGGPPQEISRSMVTQGRKCSCKLWAYFILFLPGSYNYSIIVVVARSVPTLVSFDLCFLAFSGFSGFLFGIFLGRLKSIKKISWDDWNQLGNILQPKLLPEVFDQLFPLTRRYLRVDSKIYLVKLLQRFGNFLAKP